VSFDPYTSCHTSDIVYGQRFFQSDIAITVPYRHIAAEHRILAGKMAESAANCGYPLQACGAHISLFIETPTCAMFIRHPNKQIHRTIRRHGDCIPECHAENYFDLRTDKG
jgi:hypothetical protein